MESMGANLLAIAISAETLEQLKEYQDEAYDNLIKGLG
jgi:hypothetical protein